VSININPSSKLALKLMSLNIWEGHLCHDLLRFLETVKEVDIFCFQEVYSKAPYPISTCGNKITLDIFERIAERLSDHVGYFSPLVHGFYGNAIFLRRDIKVQEKGEVPIYVNPQYQGTGPRHNRAIQWLKCQGNNQTFYLANLHGLWNGQGKGDSPDRLEQSRSIKNFVDNVTYPLLLCGDFNLNLETSSIEMLEENLINLISRNRVKSTRTVLYTKDEKYADYIFVSPDINVKAFTVLPQVVSDHAPLLLECILCAQSSFEAIKAEKTLAQAAF
jgi:endonuclease/exonuclease/phosphatase family metal-dependent hydrolase